MNEKEQGMTLVEVLATLLLTALITTLIWTSISISLKYNIVETKKLKMQQEANYIITAIQSIHRKEKCYKTLISKNEIIISNCENAENQFKMNFETQYQYGDKTDIAEEVMPDIKNEDLKIEILDPENEDRKGIRIYIETKLTRYIP